MTTVNVTNARKSLYGIIEEVNTSHEPVHITSKKGDVVLISADDWRAIEETLFLTKIPGMSEAIKKGMKQPLSKTSNKLSW